MSSSVVWLGVLMLPLEQSSINAANSSGKLESFGVSISHSSWVRETPSPNMLRRPSTSELGKTCWIAAWPNILRTSSEHTTVSTW